MKKSNKTVGIIATMVIMSVCSYIAGTTQAKTKTVTKTVTNEVEVIPQNYISLDKCIPLDDVCGWYYDNNLQSRNFSVVIHSIVIYVNISFYFIPFYS